MRTIKLNKYVLCRYCDVVSQVVYRQGETHVENICMECGERRKSSPFITKKKLERIIECNQVEIIEHENKNQ